MSHFDGHVRELGPVPEALLAPLDRLLENSRDTFLVENAHKPNKFGDFEKSTQHIVFKFPLELEDHTRSKYKPIWEKYRAAVEPIIAVVTPFYGYANGQTCRIMLAKLKAGGVIKKTRRRHALSRCATQNPCASGNRPGGVFLGRRRGDSPRPRCRF